MNLRKPTTTLNPSLQNHLMVRVRQTAAQEPGRLLYTFLEDGEDHETNLTFGQLDQRARAIAGHLQSQGLQGQRALLLYPPGMDFIEGFFGCLYAGVIAVPAFPPDPNRLERMLPRLQSIAKDCGAKVLLTTKPLKSAAAFITHQAPEFSEMEWLATDKVESAQAEKWREPEWDPSQLAFLQYTSGSTGEPKGVMITHGNLSHNLEIIRQGFQVIPEDKGVIWLPPYHDMGLVGGIFGSAYCRNSSILFSPLHFLQKPIRWLKAISKYGGTISGGPNFAFEMCLKKITPEQKQELDLSHWTLAFTGAELIQPETLRKFQDAFSICGFSGNAFLPCYGLAESTLMVTGRARGSGIHTLPVPKERLNGLGGSKGVSGKYSEVIGCGVHAESLRLVIADPETLRSRSDGEVGEILVTGSSVAPGYWENPEQTKLSFGIRLSGNGQEKFLRTGDLGFIQENELFVTGRIKDLIVIRGQNHYPQDLEKTIQVCHPSFRPGGTAAISINLQREEKLLVVQEVDEDKLPEGKTGLENLFKFASRAVSEKHDLELHQLILIEKGRLPKTSSGKIQRFACREGWLAGDLPVLQALSRERVSEKRSLKIQGGIHLKNNHDISSIQFWLARRLADLLEVSPDQIDPTQPFTDYGLDSKDAVNISGELEDQLGKPLSPTLLWKYPTLQSLAKHLAHEHEEEEEEE
jgi:acyl-CoA synthetase (AMP-forming)/AMP-acid ligase II/acyl carrier protein